MYLKVKDSKKTFLAIFDVGPARGGQFVDSISLGGLCKKKIRVGGEAYATKNIRP
jgi:hypothetical protein